MNSGNIKDSIYYVYRYIRLDTSVPFYVGMGTGRRFQQLSARNRIFKRIIKKIPFKVELIKNNLTKEQSYAEETRLIGLYWKYGYCEANILLGGNGGPNGYKHSEETRKKMSVCQKGRRHSIETRKKISDGNKGKKISEEHRLKIREKNLGKKHPPRSPEQRLAISQRKLGQKHTAESKAKMSQIKMGKKASPEARNKMSIARKGKKREISSEKWKIAMQNAHKGKIVSAETRLKMSISKRNMSLETRRKIAESKIGKIPHNAKPIVDTLTGTIWSSLKKAAQANSIHYKTLAGYLRGDRPNKTNLRYFVEPTMLISENK